VNANRNANLTPRPNAGRQAVRRCIEALAFGWLMLLAALPARAQTDRVWTINEAQVALSDSPTQPANSAAWKTQTLPDLWGASRPGVSGYAWYRMDFEVGSQGESPYAVYAPSMRTVSAVYVNDALVGQSGEFGRWEGWRPQWFAVPRALLRPGMNRMVVRLWVAEGTSGALSVVKVGEAAALRAEYERELFLSVTGLQFVCVISLVIGVYMGLLWLSRRRDSAYGYFALGAISFAVMVVPEFVLVPPIPVNPWFGLYTLAKISVDVCTCMFALRHAGWHWPRFERVLWATLGITFCMGLTQVAGASGTWMDRWDSVWVPLVLSWMGIFFASAWRRRRPDDILLALAAPWCLADDIWLEFFAPPLTVSVGNYAFLPLYGVIGWILLRRFAQSLNESEQLNKNLEQRVEQKQAELQANFQRLQQLEREQAIAEERSRIMSDMHDGIGAQLISTLGMAEHGQLSSQEMAAALRECLDDLRLTIDSMEPTDNDLLPALGNFRYRVDPRLKRQGITLDWQVGDVPRLACLTPRNLLHLLRILQEAFTNVLKHAGASLIRVETGLMADEQQVFIRVSDNGAGFSGDHRGRGLANMCQRAERLGGVLQVEPSPSGTTLELLLPVA
jgi:signal transduction histidine kinase